jgi:hypothetical protein
MQKIYLLLRNNKQSGPHTLDELVKFQLRPLDLIWVEGRSSGWKYPTEIEALAKHVKEEGNTESETGYVNSSPDLVLPKQSAKKNDNKKNGPQAKVYVKLPTHYDLSREVSDALNDNLNHVNEPFEKKRKKEDEQLNTKYVRDLDDIREQYSEWIYQQQTSRKNSVSPRRLWVASAVIILLVGGFYAQKWSMPSKNLSAAVVADSVAKKKEIAPQKNKSSKTKKTSRATAQKKSKKVDSTSTARISSGKKEQVSASSSKDSSVNRKNTVPTARIFRQVDITYSRDTAHKEGISGLQFMVHNKSDFKLSVVAVDVLYHHEGQQLLKETIYFNNVSPAGKSTTAAPNHQKATSVTYHLALVSTDDSIFYGK